MTTPIIMLVLMIAPYLAGRAASAVLRRDFGIGHFVQTAPMAQMLPPWVPERKLLVYLTGALELALAAGFVAPKSRWFTGWVTAVMLVVFFPVNIYASIHRIPMGGHAWGPVYLLIRTPLQAIILFWVYWFTIRQPNRALRADAPRALRQ